MRSINLSVWAVHVLTASGAALALLALMAAAQSAWQTAFYLLGVAFIVDGVDGPLARRYRVAARAPWFDGVALDLIVDYTTYVLVPALMVAQSGLVPEGFRTASGALIAVVGALYLADTRMKTPQAAFRGFPAVWNAVVLQLFVYGLPPAANLVAIVALAVLTFVPLDFVHPFRVVSLRRLSAAMAVLWGGAAIVSVFMEFRPGPFGVAALAVSSLYFAFIGIALQVHRARRGRFRR